MIDDILESATENLAEAHAKLNEAREAMRRATDTGGREDFGHILARLNRLVGELERMEGLIVRTYHSRPRLLEAEPVIRTA